MYNFLEIVFMNVVEGFFKIDEVQIKLLLLFCILFNDVFQCEYLVDIFLFWFEFCLFYLQFDIYGFGYFFDDNFSYDFIWNGEKCYFMLVIIVI